MKQLLFPLFLMFILIGCENATDNAPVGASTSEVEFRAAMNKLWEDHVSWTRNVIINVMDDAGGFDEALARLLTNQDDIGNAIKPYYGDAAGNQLAALLRYHIIGAGEVLVAAKTGNGTLAQEQAEWAENADSIATFLSTANPTNWPLDDMKAMMREHLNLTTNEAVARLQKNYAADVAAYDAVHTQILVMADMLADGIIKQFPEKF